jgi:hypothetical protein
VSSLAPQPKTYICANDPGFGEDPELALILKDGVFYQKSIDGAEVAILVDRLGPLPSSNAANTPRASTRK